ncbi:P1 family peptidase [Candidatus Uhrbacteria bacterium]|nr:P1 family peptidase [Candidatus Uhrbacteria bacterium]
MKQRFRQYGLSVGLLPTGPKNTIADVAGLRLGHCTKIAGDDIRTGVTVIDPGLPNLFDLKLPAAVAVGNGYGKVTGVTQIQELGVIEAPIALTNTMAVGPVMRALADQVVTNTPSLQKTQEPILNGPNVFVGEVNDSRLNNFYQDGVGQDEVKRALASLSPDFELGSVGAGTGGRAFSWKGGLGSASRMIQLGKKTYTVGTLAQTNFGGSLTILGVPVGKLLGKTDFDTLLSPAGDGSGNIIIATDAPLSSRQLERLARRAFLGLARTGSVLNHSSGDYSLAFSTNRAGLEGSGNPGYCLPDADLSIFFLAVVESVEESVYDALFLAETMTGRNGFTLPSLPADEAVSLLRKRMEPRE